MMYWVAFAVALACSAVLARTAFVELRARRRLRRLHAMDAAVTSGLTGAPGHLGGTSPASGHPRRFDGDRAADAIGLGVGAGGLSLYDLYAAASDHEEALHALAHKYNRVLAEVESPTEWLRWLIDKSDEGRDSIINACVGELGERHAVDYFNSLDELRDQGVFARQIENRSHAGTDIEFVHEDGTPTDIPEVSVKTYDPRHVHEFLHAAESGDASHYAVNSDLFAALQEKGEIGRLAAEGIDVADAGYDWADLHQQAADATNDIADAADVGDHVPWIAATLFGYKAVQGLGSWMDGKKTGHEFGADLTFDAARVAVGGAGAVAGAKLGGAIGTWIAPGAGTLIFGIVGGVAGALGLGKLTRWVKEEWKFGTIRDCLDEFFHEYAARLQNAEYVSECANGLAAALMGTRPLRSQLDLEATLASNYDAEVLVLAPGSVYREPTPMGALSRRHEFFLSRELDARESAAADAPFKVYDLAQRTFPEDPDAAGRVFAGVLMGVSDVFREPGSARRVREFRREVGRYPHHPWRFVRDGEEVPAAELLGWGCAQSYTPAQPESPLLHRPPGSSGRIWAMVLCGAILAVAAWWLAEAGTRPW